MRVLIVVLALLTISAQPEPDDPHAYCWNPKSSGSLVKQRERDRHAHKCACHLMCQYNADGSISGDQEDGTCKLYCKREQCVCHVEEACEKG